MLYTVHCGLPLNNYGSVKQIKAVVMKRPSLVYPVIYIAFGPNGEVIIVYSDKNCVLELDNELNLSKTIGQEGRISLKKQHIHISMIKYKCNIVTPQIKGIHQYT